MARGMRVATAWAGAVVLAVALTACIGIPSSGGVNAGPAIQPNGDSSFAAVPLGPLKNASKQDILTDFMQAATSPDGDYAIARLFLTKSASSGWKPSQSVLIRQGLPDPRPEPNGDIVYPVTTRASVDATGVYSEQSTPSTQVLKFGFTRVGGQWRISSLGDGTVLSSTSFPQVFSAETLYFFDPSYRYLVPDVRWFPTGTAEPSRIVSALLGGPVSWLQNGVVASAFPAGVSLASPVQVKGTTATVDLSAEAANTKSIDRARMSQQLETSLQATNATLVDMTVLGAPLAVTDTGDRAVTALSVNPAPLIELGKKFGFAPRLEAIGHLSSQIVALDAREVTVGRDQSSAAVLAAGGVYLVTNDVTKPVLVDPRPGLVAPSIDPFRYVWSVPGSDASAIQATTSDRVAHSISSSIPPNSTIVSMDVSHDGSRLLVYLLTPSGPQLAVAGIVRHGTVPTSLGPLLVLPVSSDDPVDATWLDDRTVAVVTESAGTDTVTSFPLGGISGESTTTEGVAVLVGGSGDGQLRALTTNGRVQELRSSGWQDTGLAAAILATQQ